MAEYQLSYSGAQIDEKLGKVDTIETLANNTADTVYSHSNSILTLQNNTALETTSFTAKGITVRLYKQGRFVSLEVNNTLSGTTWAAGSGNAVTSGLADKWLPLNTVTEPNTGFEYTSGKVLVMTTDGKFYHTTGSTISDGGRVRGFMTYISKA